VLFNILPILITAGLTILGNIIYFEYKSRRDSSKKILRERLTKLLLPVYFILEEDGMVLEAIANHPDGDPWEYESGQLDRLREKLVKIVSDNLYLADDELHTACMKFLAQAYVTNPNERFQILHNRGTEEAAKDVDGEAFKEFKRVVIQKYESGRRSYL